MNPVLLAALAGALLSGCVSIATHEEQMRRCRAASAHTGELEARVADLEKQNDALEGNLAEKSAEVTDVRATYDELVDKLKSDVSKGDVDVKQTGENLTITLGDKVLFRSGQWELQPRGKQVLAQVAEVLRKVEDDKRIRVDGHTDNVPISGSLKARFPTNWDLSSARASAVVRFLEAQGVPGGKLMLAAYGETRPVEDNSTAEGRKLNRRVEISLVP